MLTGNTLRDLVAAVISEMQNSLGHQFSDRDKTIIYCAIRSATDRINAKLEIDTEKAEGVEI